MKKLIPAAVIATILAAAGPAAPTPPPPAAGDYAATALNILPPGESGSLLFPPNATDQLPLYDSLTPLLGNVTAGDVAKSFKPERFGLAVGEKPVRTERPRPGLRILRDGWGVPHVYGKTRADVEYGAGWATAEDRSLFMELLRGPGRIAALDVPGVNAFTLATSAQGFEPSAATEGELAKEIALVDGAGAKGHQLVRDVDAYVAGINAYYKANHLEITPWTRNDIVAVGALLGADLGVGGGDETRRAMLLSALQQRLGAARGRGVWDDLREQLDPESPVSVPGDFPYDPAAASEAGNVVIDDGSFEPWGGGSAQVNVQQPRRQASNALLVGASRSATGHPLAVMGPQVGYFFPQILLELDLHGGGIDARGASFPGLSFYVLLGRGKDFAWSATSANNDVVDHYVETLCGDDTHYMFKGSCRAMGDFLAGVLKGKGSQPDRRLAYRTTVHGPVIGYAKVGGKRVAISTLRSTRGRELLSALAFQDLNTNRVTSPKTFFDAMNQLEFTFNWFYVDNEHIAMFSSGRMPIRAPGVASGLPTNGAGEYEWGGFLPNAKHVQAIDPAGGAIVNWNNKPGGPGTYSASDDNWDYGSVQRVELLNAGVAATPKHTLATLVGAMNRAATQDIRPVRVLPALDAILKTGPAPSARAQRMLDLLDAWRANGSSRLDRDLDGKVDDPGAAIIDAAWPRVATAVMSPVLGDVLVARLREIKRDNDPANPSGSSYYGGWYGYVEKDLRRLAGGAVAGAFHERYCGAGDLAACRASLWAALDAAGADLAAAQGPDPAAWRADATKERISFGFLPSTARWTNRPTFQQVITFDRHRPRR